MVETLHGGLGWPIAITLIAISFVSSLITVAFGIGGGAVMLAVLATLLPAPAIVPVHGLVQLGSNTGRAALMLKHMRLDLLGGFTAGALVGIVLGSSVVVQLHPGWIQVCVGLFILWSVVAKPPAFLRRSGPITGAISSFLSTYATISPIGSPSGFSASRGSNQLSINADKRAPCTASFDGK